MRTRSLLLLTSLAGLGLPSSIAATEITFDDYTAVNGLSNAAPDRYQSQGVIFSQDIPIENVQVVEPGFMSAFTSLGGTSPNEIMLNNATTRQLDLHFVVPGTAIPATVDSVEILFMDTDVGTTLGTIEAFDSSNALLTSVTELTPAAFGAILSVNTPGISWVRVSVDQDGGGLDNLRFTTVPATCTGVGVLPRSTQTLASGQSNHCENWLGVSQPGQDLRNADLSMTDLGAANLSGCLLIDVDFTGASLASASLVNVQLGGATLNGANLTGASLAFATLNGALYNETTIFPSGFTYDGGPSGLPNNVRPWEARMIPAPEPSAKVLLLSGTAVLIAVERFRRGFI